MNLLLFFTMKKVTYIHVQLNHNIYVPDVAYKQNVVYLKLTFQRQNPFTLS